MFLTNPDHRDRIQSAGQHRQGMNTLGIIAAEAAYNKCENWLDQLMSCIGGTHDWVDAFVRSDLPHVATIKPKGTSRAWLDVSKALDPVELPSSSEDGSRDIEFQRHLVEEAHIHISPGSSYDLPGTGRMRMDLATSRQLVERASVTSPPPLPQCSFG